MVRDFYFGGAPKSLQTVTAVIKLKKSLLLGRKAMIKLDLGHLAANKKFILISFISYKIKTYKFLPYGSTFLILSQATRYM